MFRAQYVNEGVFPFLSSFRCGISSLDPEFAVTLWRILPRNGDVNFMVILMGTARSKARNYADLD